MPNRQPKHHPLRSLLHTDRLTKNAPKLRKLYSQADQNQSIQSHFDACISERFIGQFVVNHINKGELTVTSSSAAFAQMFRFEQDTVLAHLQQRLGSRKLTSLKIRIRPNIKKQVTVAPPIELSDENAKLILDEAAHIEDEALKAALERLARRAKD